MRLLPYGEHAVLVELDDVTVVPQVAASLGSLDGVAEAVPGARTVLVRAAAGTEIHRLHPRIRERAARPGEVVGAVHPPRLVEIPVTYDGADLNELAARTGLSPREIVERHCATTYTVAFCGFAPGFAYLSGLDPVLQVPRRAQPRTSVPAGSVAVAGPYSAVYPRSSPGGWHLLGRSGITLFDLHHDPPALLAPPALVRFVPT